MLYRFFLIFLTLAAVHLQAASDTPPTPAQQEQPAPITLPHSEAAPAPLPSSAEMTTSYESAFIRMIVTLVGLIALVFLTVWLLKRLGSGRLGKFASSRSIKILEKRALSPKSVLYLVEVGDKQVLVSESQFEVRSLAVLEPLNEQPTRDS